MIDGANVITVLNVGVRFVIVALKIRRSPSVYCTFCLQQGPACKRVK